MIYYRIDENRYWTGETANLNPAQGIPPDYVTGPAPQQVPGRWNVWYGSMWLLTSVSPEEAGMPPRPQYQEQVEAERVRRSAFAELLVTKSVDVGDLPEDEIRQLAGIGAKVLQWVQMNLSSANALKDAQPMVRDFADDSRWPSALNDL